MGHERVAPGRERLELRSKVWLELGGKVVLSDWRVRLLEAIDETGSLANAAKALDVPYRTAWYKLREVEDRLGLRLLETRSGGSDGGASRLTPDARELVARFRRASAGLDELLDHRLHAELGDTLLKGRRPRGEERAERHLRR